MNDLPFSIDRSIVIAADRDTVFRYFTDSERWARWWGEGSRIDPRPGGEVLVCYPGGVATAQGHVVEIVPPERIVFTYGYDRPGTPIPPGASRVTITVTEHPGGALVRLRHDVGDEAVRDEHVAGWRHQMGVFANVVMDEHDVDATAIIDRYFAVWSERDPKARRAAIVATCSDDVVYRDRFGFTNGHDDLDGHVQAAQKHLAATLGREGEILVTLGMAIVEWTASKDGAIVARGRSVIELAPDGRVARVTGFWG
jgi:uncharacterized protein YndB with AHSA1/START domain